MSKLRLVDCVSVRGRFYRSVHLVRDWEASLAQEGQAGEYILTPRGGEIARALMEGVQQAGKGRAWSLVGPYGTGKSAFVLFLTQLLAQERPAHPSAQALREASPNMPRLYPILVMGQRASLPRAILTALAQSMEPLDAAGAALLQASLADSATPPDVVAWVARANQRARQSGWDGLFLAIDEFGKFLEYAALHPEAQDVFVMQQLAELSERSSHPLLLLTVQHTATAEYLHGTTEVQRVEWQKVQGRFASIAFYEAPQQMLRLMVAALEHHFAPSLLAAYEQRLAAIASAPAFEEARQRFAFDQVALGCVPLHPVAALLLWAIFRSKLAQNERSLFAFLTAQEPFAFQEFLATTPCDAQAALYPADRLYDYVMAALGGAVYLGDHAYHWRELDQGLLHLPHDASETAGALLRLVGLLGMYGPAVGLAATADTLALALDQTARDQIDEALGSLERQQLIVYRRLTNSYTLWEGAHIDLEACAAQAQQHVGLSSLAERLRLLLPLRPLVARGHYIQSGTLRFFTVDCVDAAEAASPPVPPLAGDGSILYILTTEATVRERLIAAYVAQGALADAETRIWAFPQSLRHIELPLQEAELWQWVQENVPALAGDEGARKEVAIRLQLAKQRLAEAFQQSFDPTAVTWVQGGKAHAFVTARAFSRWLSDLCDKAFRQCPPLRNELLNREKPSSAAVAARRALLEAMLTRPHEPQLGIERTPPELSMYRSLLASGGFHELRGREGWGFGVPDVAWLPVWDEIESFLAQTRSGRRPVTDLYRRLQQPPYGMRAGPLPVLLCAALLSGGQEIAVYEEGVFVPELRIELLERLSRNPEQFELQRYAFSPEERDVLEGIRLALGEASPSAATESPLLSVVRALVVTVARLPAYAKQTRRLDDPTYAKARDVMLKTRDPYALLFQELPAVLGVGPTERDFAAVLHRCLLALRNAYPRLLDEIEQGIRGCFDLHGSSQEAAAALRARAAILPRYATEPTLLLFVKEASQIGAGRDWREALGRAVNRGKAPMHWNDAEASTFQALLRRVASDFVRLEELAVEQRETGANQVVRVGILQQGLEEARAVVAVTPERAEAVRGLVAELRQAMESLDEGHAPGESRLIRVAALAEVALAILQENGYHA